jgi:hypothetical protein
MRVASWHNFRLGLQTRREAFYNAKVFACVYHSQATPNVGASCSSSIMAHHWYESTMVHVYGRTYE